MTTLLSRRFQLAVLGISYLMCGSSSSLLTMQRRSSSFSDKEAYALYSYKVTIELISYCTCTCTHNVY